MKLQVEVDIEVDEKNKKLCSGMCRYNDMFT